MHVAARSQGFDSPEARAVQAPGDHHMRIQAAITELVDRREDHPHVQFALRIAKPNFVQP
jgi:hypothetical protein